MIKNESLGFEVIDFEIEGIAPTIMHNGRLANPLDPYAVDIKKITSKNTKTEEDHYDLAKLEFEGGLYINDQGPYWPADNIGSMLWAAAKKFRQGPTWKEGCCVLDDAQLMYKGPRDIDGLWNDKRFVSTVRCKHNKSSTVMRTRPIFHNWKLKFQVQYEPDIADRANVIKWAETAARRIGLSDWRPRNGRFIITNTE